MELRANWEQIRNTFEKGIRSSLHSALATVNPDGSPHVTPIGFVFLRDDYTAFYFEEYSKRIPENLAHDARVCLMVVNSDRFFWLKSLYKGRFSSLPGIRLYGVCGERRLATEHERAAYQARVKSLRKLKGYRLIWQDLRYVRDIKLERFEPVVYPTMSTSP